MVFMSDPAMSDTLESLRADAAAEGAAGSRGERGSSVGTMQETLETMDATELQQLRGIFAAHDEDKDGLLTDSELQESLRALGFIPNDELMRTFSLPTSAATTTRLPRARTRVPLSAPLRSSVSEL